MEDNGHNTKPEEVAGFYSSQNGTKINISISNVSVTTSSPATTGFFVSLHLSLHSTMSIRFILVVTLLLITNFIVWSWAIEKHPEIQPVSMDLV